MSDPKHEETSADADNQTIIVRELKKHLLNVCIPLFATNETEFSKSINEQKHSVLNSFSFFFFFFFLSTILMK